MQKKYSDREVISSSKDAEKIFRSIWSDTMELKECSYALFMNRSNKVLGWFVVSVGGTSGTTMDVKVIFQTALKANASSLVIVHNHPSGNLNASEADIEITSKIKKAGEILDISLLDHIIITDESYLSMADEGLIL